MFQQFSKVALVFNLMFAFCVLLRFLPVDPEGTWLSILIIGGWMLSFPVNLVMHSWLLILFLKKRLPATAWVIIINLLIFLFQLAYFFFL